MKVTPIGNDNFPNIFATADKVNHDSLTSANRTAVSGFASQTPQNNRSVVNSVQRKRVNEQVR